jgi:hypothetical protein
VRGNDPVLLPFPAKSFSAAFSAGRSWIVTLVGWSRPLEAVAEHQHAVRDALEFLH